MQTSVCLGKGMQKTNSPLGSISIFLFTSFKELEKHTYIVEEKKVWKQRIFSYLMLMQYSTFCFSDWNTKTYAVIEKVYNELSKI